MHINLIKKKLKIIKPKFSAEKNKIPQNFLGLWSVETVSSILTEVFIWSFTYPKALFRGNVNRISSYKIKVAWLSNFKSRSKLNHLKANQGWSHAQLPHLQWQPFWFALYCTLLTIYYFRVNLTIYCILKLRETEFSVKEHRKKQNS